VRARNRASQAAGLNRSRERKENFTVHFNSARAIFRVDGTGEAEAFNVVSISIP
jgi:hypothetical protein